MREFFTKVFCVAIVLSGISYSLDVHELDNKVYADQEMNTNGEELPDEH